MASSATAPTIAIIGAGFAGLGAAYYLKQAGFDNFTIFEKAEGIGGVWRENTYPGAACDVPSHMYSYSFEPHYPWAWRYGKQAEILEYQQHVARKHGIESHIRFGREVAGADFDEAHGLWRVRFTDGAVHEANVLISAVGQLHRPAIPRLPGIERYTGRTFHSARWDHGFDLRDKTVAVIGTGASAVQFVPEIAKEVKQLYVFQRSPGWCIPKVERRFNRFERGLLDAAPIVHDMDRWRIFWLMEFISTAINQRNWTAKLADAYLKLTAGVLMRLQVRDPALRKKLTPDFPIGCKRTLLSNDWLRALARPNVEVIAETVGEVTPTGVRSSDGRLREVDAIVYGTGFAATEFLAPMEMKGLGGGSLREQWRGGAQAYLGLGVSGFPNFLTMYGPNTNLGAGSIIYMIEQQARYIVQYVQRLHERGLRWLDVRTEAQQAWNEELQRRSRETAFESGCHSWYITDGRNTNNWVGPMREYRQRVLKLDPADYREAASAVMDSAAVAAVA